MPTTVHKTYRLAPETLRQIADLSRLWGTVQMVSPPNVIAECVKRVHAAEFAQRKPKQSATKR